MGELGYRVEMWPDDDGQYTAIAPDFGPNVSAFGDTPEEALEQIAGAIEAAIEVYEEEGWELPTPKRFSGKLVLRMPQQLHRRLARQANSEGVSLNTLLVSYLAEQVGPR